MDGGASDVSTSDSGANNDGSSDAAPGDGSGD
jgi:hypothetical protein